MVPLGGGITKFLMSTPVEREIREGGRGEARQVSKSARARNVSETKMEKVRMCVS